MTSVNNINYMQVLQATVTKIEALEIKLFEIEARLAKIEDNLEAVAAKDEYRGDY